MTTGILEFTKDTNLTFKEPNNLQSAKDKEKLLKTSRQEETDHGHMASGQTDWGLVAPGMMASEAGKSAANLGAYFRKDCLSRIRVK